MEHEESNMALIKHKKDSQDKIDFASKDIINCIEESIFKIIEQLMENQVSLKQR
jgi:hypothetical protein